MGSKRHDKHQKAAWSRGWYSRGRRAMMETRIFSPSAWSAKRREAKLRGLEFVIERADYPIPEFCPVLGIPIDWRDWNHKPSLDRINNAFGYVPGNVAVISMKANRLKHDATIDDLRALLAYMEGNDGGA